MGQPLWITAVRYNLCESRPSEGRGPKSWLTEYIFGTNFVISPIGVLSLEKLVWVEYVNIRGRRQRRLQLIIREREFPAHLQGREDLKHYVLTTLRG